MININKFHITFTIEYFFFYFYFLINNNCIRKTSYSFINRSKCKLSDTCTV